MGISIFFIFHVILSDLAKSITKKSGNITGQNYILFLNFQVFIALFFRNEFFMATARFFCINYNEFLPR